MEGDKKSLVEPKMFKGSHILEGGAVRRVESGPSSEGTRGLDQSRDMSETVEELGEEVSTLSRLEGII